MENTQKEAGGFMSWFHHSLFPLFLIVVCPSAAILMWVINVDNGGSVLSFWNQIQQQGFITVMHNMWAPVYMGTATAWKIVGIFALVQLILMRVVPGKRFEGPITPKGNIPVYKANGLACYLITLGLFLGCSYGLHWFSATIVYDNFAAIIGALNIFSLVFCVFLYIKGRFAPSSTDCGSSGNVIFDYYWGTELYPRFLGWDIKMFTNCRFGMMAWPVIVLSFAAKQAAVYGLSDSMLVAMIVMMTYLTKFFIWETGYLRSMDIMHDRAGFYICWGCLVWVPAVYTSPIMYLVNNPVHLGAVTATVIAVLGVTSVMINFFADRQRQKVRAANGKCKVWGKEPVLIHAEYTTKEGERKKTVLLASGWWGLARHFHYLPEIMGAFFWTVPALFFNALPYFYVAFLTILLVHRSLRDEDKCRLKYGKYWKEYCEAVPSRIVPGIRFGNKFPETVQQ
jgi:7-dehydrocholesterol reductase